MSWRFLRALSCPARIIAAVSPLVPLVPLIAGFVALVAGVLVLRTYGPNYRIGRLLASTPVVNWSKSDQDAMAALLYQWQGAAPWGGGCSYPQN